MLMQRFWTAAAAVCLLWAGAVLWTGCSEEESPTSSPGTLTVVWQTRPPNLELSSTDYVSIRAQVSGIEPTAVDSVKAFISDAAGSPIADFHLYDDANFYQHEDALEFCSPYSGDVVAHNGIFSRLMNGQFAPSSGTYTFTLNAWAGDRQATSPDSFIVVAQNSAPTLSNLFFPDTLYSGAQIQIHLKVMDADTVINDSVAAVAMSFYTAEGAQLDTFALSDLGGDQYGMTVQPDIALGLTSDLYIFAFRAWDTFEAVSDSLGTWVYLQNAAPHLGEPEFPDTVTLPEVYEEVLISLPAWDDQTNADIDSVNMLSLKPNGEYANEGQPIPLVDTGEWGDEVAGDSIFSINAVLYDTSLVGTYIFTFWARDLAGNKTDDLIDSMVVVAP
jgi:hypothetical protein